MPSDKLIKRLSPEGLLKVIAHYELTMHNRRVTSRSIAVVGGERRDCMDRAMGGYQLDYVEYEIEED